MLSVKSLRMRTRAGQAGLLDVTFTVSSFERDLTDADDGAARRLGIVVLLVVFLAARFPYRRLLRSAARGARARPTGARDRRIGSRARRLGLGGPEVVASGVHLRWPAARTLVLDEVRVRPAWSFAWLRGSPRCASTPRARRRAWRGVVAPDRVAGTWSEVRHRALPWASSVDALAAPGRGSRRAGRAGARADGAWSGPRGRCAGGEGSLALPGLPVAIPFDDAAAPPLALGAGAAVTTRALALRDRSSSASAHGTAQRLRAAAARRRSRSTCRSSGGPGPARAPSAHARIPHGADGHAAARVTGSAGRSRPEWPALQIGRQHPSSPNSCGSASAVSTDSSRRSSARSATRRALRILALLEREELAVQELMDVLGMAQSRVSRHLGILREAGLLRDRRDGTFVLYRFEPPARRHLARRAGRSRAARSRRTRSRERDAAALARVARGAPREEPQLLRRTSAPSGTRSARSGTTTRCARARSRASLPRGLRVLDVGTGTGVARARARDRGLRRDRGRPLAAHARRRAREARGAGVTTSSCARGDAAGAAARRRRGRRRVRAHGAAVPRVAGGGARARWRAS